MILKSSDKQKKYFFSPKKEKDNTEEKDKEKEINLDNNKEVGKIRNSIKSGFESVFSINSLLNKEEKEEK